MPNYDKAVGTAGTMRISDNGSTVSFIIMCSDSATFVGSYVWSGVVNGASVGGTTNLPAGFGSKTLGTWTVSSTQTVTFHQNATGTQGLGGAADHSAAISRASVPSAPGTPVVTNIGTNGATFTWGAANANGSAINNYGLYVSESPSFASHVYQAWEGVVLTKTLSGILVPGRTYYTRNRAQNGVGIGPYGVTVSFQTLSGAYVSDGTTWKPCEIFTSDGTAWKSGAVQISDGTIWKAAG